ncbi:MAG: hypothetical protein WB609_13465 [Candidatus Cybelea sp.]
MAKILLQTTIPFAEDDWNVSRFSLLRDALVADGHEVVARDEEVDENHDDDLLMRLPDSDFDQVWLMAVDTGDGLTQGESDAIIEFRKRGGGVLTARDAKTLGFVSVILARSVSSIIFTRTTSSRAAPKTTTRTIQTFPIRTTTPVQTATIRRSLRSSRCIRS